MTRAIPGRPGDLIWVDRNSQGHWLRNSDTPLRENLAQLDDTEKAALAHTCGEILDLIERHGDGKVTAA